MDAAIAPTEASRRSPPARRMADDERKAARSETPRDATSKRGARRDEQKTRRTKNATNKKRDEQKRDERSGARRDE
ncbi:hypothetical protein [Dactylosporangium sp. CA-139066]|uniref:hypothetical protein n=1 Tax=Dactylosporangium sp. CA-139066 TaxID=3239930 RepID=UPI003D8D4692